MNKAGCAECRYFEPWNSATIYNMGVSIVGAFRKTVLDRSPALQLTNKKNIKEHKRIKLGG